MPQKAHQENIGKDALETLSGKGTTAFLIRETKSGVEKGQEADAKKKQTRGQFRQ